MYKKLATYKMYDESNTNREKFTKSLKFEALPEDATLRAIEAQHLMADNEEMLAKAKELEAYVDVVIKHIICNSLDHVSFDMDALYEAYIKKDYKEYDTLAKELETKIVDTVTEYLPSGMKKIKDINSAMFIKTVMPSVIETIDMEETDKEKALQLIEELNSCGSLMDKFLTTRVTAVTTWMTKRVIENFEIYADNMSRLQVFLDSEDAKDFVIDFPEVTSFASAGYYELCLTPNAINSYNRLISGNYDSEGNCVTKGYNQLITELNLKHSHETNYDGKFYRPLKKLYQQILMPKEKLFTIESLKNDDDLRCLLKELGEKVSKKTYFDIIETIKSANKEGIVVAGMDLHTFSNVIYGNHATIPDAITEKMAIEIEKQLETADKKSDIQRLNKEFESITNTMNASFYSIAYIENLMQDDTIFGTYIERLQSSLKAIITHTETLQAERILGSRKIFGRKEAKIIVKNYTESLLEFKRLVKVIDSNKDNDLQNIVFYERLHTLCEPLTFCVKAFNLCRNYLTAAPKDLAEEKIMCFGQPMLLLNSWWKTTMPKMKAGICSILEKDGKYYYVFKSPKAKPVTILPCREDTGYHMLSYLKGQDANKLFAKMVFSKDVKHAFDVENVTEVEHPFIHGLTVTKEQYKYYTEKTYSLDSVRKGKATEEQRLHALGVMIDLYKEMIPLYESTACFTFHLKETEAYNDMGLFMEDCNRYMTFASWVNVSREDIDAAIEDGSLLSFLITNRNMYKDNNEKTTYAQTFLYMMSEENLKDMTFKLNAKPMMTFRPACLPLEITHPKGSILVNKNDARGRKIPGRAYVELLDFYNGRLAEDKLSKEALAYQPFCVTKVADYDIAKNYRYMVDKFFISFSYTVNSDVSDREKNTISEEVAENIKSGCKLLSVVRGTSDLLYYALYDENRNIIKKESLNVIGGVDYCSLLRQLTMENRSEKADNWNLPKRVTKIKESYVNFAISEIMKVAIENNAIIVIEKINDQFKDRMALVDNQVYKLFETKLKSRLLDYRNKKFKMGTPGSIAIPLQLCKTTLGNPMQNGILFEVNGAYTRGLDAETGFVDLFDWSKTKTIATKRSFLQKFDTINVKGDQIIFTFDYKNFALRNNIDSNKLTQTEWTVVAGKPCTIFDGETYHINDAPARDMIEKYNFEDLEAASGKAINELFNLFKKTLRATSVKKCKENSAEYYSSPVTAFDNKNFSSAENAARVLAKKMYYFLDNVDDTSDFAITWLNYVA